LRSTPELPGAIQHDVIEIAPVDIGLPSGSKGLRHEGYHAGYKEIGNEFGGVAGARLGPMWRMVLAKQDKQRQML
jgi:hypothetical protein